MKLLAYEQLVRLGQSTGCHQMPERSLFIRGKQFPICARCTGVLIGKTIAYSLFFVCRLPLRLCMIGCAMMFCDWFVQYIGLCASTNFRRLVTGIIGGGSLATINCMAVKYILQYLIK